MKKYLSESELQKSLGILDLTNNPNHAISLLVAKIQKALELKYQVPAQVERGSPVVLKVDNYDHLGYPDTEVTLSSRYTRYVDEEKMLRTQMTSVIPGVLKSYSKNPRNQLYLCPGMVYRRDVVDRTHVGEPHQMDVWYLQKGVMTRTDLLELIEVIVSVVGEVLKTKLTYRCNETSHHYTDDGLEVEINYQGRWLEILECGLAGKRLLKSSGINPEEYGGLALGMGLDRLVMIAKGIGDIRVLRDPDERVQNQMINLDKYKEVSKQPAIKRDLSLAVSEGLLLEELSEKIMNTLGTQASLVEEIKLVAQTSYHDLPEVARKRLGIQPGQDNYLVRIILRHPSRSIPTEEANDVYKNLYGQIHEGEGGYVMD